MGCIPVKLGRARNRNDARQFLSQYADAAKKMADARYVSITDDRFIRDPLINMQYANWGK